MAIKYKSANYLLIVAILLLAALPVRYHLHHLHETGSEASAHEHTIDIHVLADSSDQSHHDETTSITASPNGIINKSNPDFYSFILPTFLLLLLPATYKPVFLKRNFITNLYQRHTLFFTPLLRAPPLN